MSWLSSGVSVEVVFCIAQVDHDDATTKRCVVATMEMIFEAFSRIGKRKILKISALKCYANTFLTIEAKLKKLNMKHWTKPYLFGFVSKYNTVYEVSGRIIQQITLGLNKQLPNGDPNFTANQGWLNM